MTRPSRVRRHQQLALLALLAAVASAVSTPPDDRAADDDRHRLQLIRIDVAGDAAPGRLTGDLSHTAFPATAVPVPRVQPSGVSSDVNVVQFRKPR